MRSSFTSGVLAVSRALLPGSLNSVLRGPIGSCSRTSCPAARAAGKASLPSGLGNSSITAFVKHLSNDVAPENITVNVVHPPFTKTDRYPGRLEARAKQLGCSLEEAEATFVADFPIGRIVEPSDIAPMILFLSSPHASAVTGQAIGIDGGSVPGIFY